MRSSTTSSTTRTSAGRSVDPRQIPAARLTAALDALATIHSPIFDTRDKVRPFRLVATDLEWSAGSGPVVEGPGEALVLAAAGRPVVYAELRGEGVPRFTGQVAAPS